MSWAGKTLIFGVIVGAVLVLAGIGFAMYYQRKGEALEKANLPLTKIKTWPPCEVITPWTALVTTKLEGNEVKFKVHFVAKEGSPPLNYGQASEFTMNFESADGFNVFTSSIPARELNRILDQTTAGDTRVIGYTWQGHSYCQADDYRRATSLSMLWSGVTLVRELPKLDLRPTPATPTPAQERKNLENRRNLEKGWLITEDPENRPIPVTPKGDQKWRNLVNWRKLERGWTPEAVRLYLGEPTSIRKASVLTFWTYGSLGTGRYGEVAFDEKGVSGWQEPQ